MTPKLQEKVLAYVKAHPWCTFTAVQDKLGYSAANSLGAMVRNGKLAREQRDVRGKPAWHYNVKEVP